MSDVRMMPITPHTTLGAVPINIPLDQIIGVWDELELARKGKNGYGGTVAEIYAYRLVFDPRGEFLNGRKEKLRELAITAASNLTVLLRKFKESYPECEIRIEVGAREFRPLLHFESVEPFNHRVHIEVAVPIKDDDEPSPTAEPTAAEIYATIKEAIVGVTNVRLGVHERDVFGHAACLELADEMARNAAQGVLELIRVASERPAAPRSAAQRLGDPLYERMQQPGFEDAIKRAFKATPEEIGRAAVDGAKIDGHQPRWGNVNNTKILSCSCGLTFCGPDPDDELSDHLARVEISKGR